MLSTCPVEIILGVLEYCRHRSLLQLRLTNRLISRLAKPLVFEKISLCEVWTQTQPRMKNLRKHGLTKHIRSICIYSSALIYHEDHDLELASLDQLFQECGPQLLRLVIRCNTTSDKNEKLTWKIRDILLKGEVGRAVRLKELVIAPGCSAGLLEFGDEELNPVSATNARPGASLFPDLESLRIKLTRGPTEGRGCRELKPFMPFISFGCEKLRSLEVDLGTERTVYDTKPHLPSMLEFDVFCPEAVQNLNIAGDIIILNTYALIRLLRPMRNIRTLRLCGIRIKLEVMPTEAGEPPRRYPKYMQVESNWIHLFLCCEGMPDLRSCSFAGCGSVPTSASVLHGGLLSDLRSFGYDGDECRVFISCFPDELEARRELHKVVMRRRRSLGLPAEISETLI